tara:strand:- start:411 stop:722 length:312 start_codon:yes stop_codon:yes gene_type:complete
MARKKSPIDRLDEIGEDTILGLSVKTLIAMAVTLTSVVGMWFALQADIKEAKELPKPEIQRIEYDLKDELIRETIMDTEEAVEEIKEQLDKIDQRLYELQQRR